MLASADDLKYFLEVASTLNVTRAAERLGITQPSLSLAIRRLEHAVGADLLLRGKNGVQLTKAGQKVSAHARTLLDEWEKLRGLALDTESQYKGRFTLGAHPSVAIYSFPHFLPKLLSNYPEIEFTLKHGLSRELCEDVISFRLDFGIVVNPVAHPDLVIKELCKDEVTLWQAAQTKVPSVLIYDGELLQSQSILKELSRKKIHFNSQITSPNLEVIASLVERGCGVGILPERVALQNGHAKVRRYSKDAPLYQDRICLVYRADAQKNSASQVIVRAIREAKI